MSDAEKIICAQGMRAHQAGRSRNSCPIGNGLDVDEFERDLCRAWFRGYDVAKSTTSLVDAIEQRITGGK